MISTFNLSGTVVETKRDSDAAVIILQTTRELVNVVVPGLMLDIEHGLRMRMRGRGQKTVYSREKSTSTAISWIVEKLESVSVASKGSLTLRHCYIWTAHIVLSVLTPLFPFSLSKPPFLCCPCPSNSTCRPLPVVSAFPPSLSLSLFT